MTSGFIWVRPCTEAGLWTSVRSLRCTAAGCRRNCTVSTSTSLRIPVILNWQQLRAPQHASKRRSATRTACCVDLGVLTSVVVSARCCCLNPNLSLCPKIADAHAPPFMLIPSFDSSLLEYRRLYPLLAAQRRAFAVDVVGWGAPGLPSCDVRVAVSSWSPTW